MPESVGDAAVVLEAGHSHLYPGAKLGGAAPPATETDCLVLFADGAQAGGRVAPADGGWRLAIGAYRTARGTAIAAKGWLIATTPEGRLRVAGRISPWQAEAGPPRQS
ncbi:hypothetical protein H0I76_00330 [Limibaculum sp. M0105]|uniref:Uncharacterized protein n=1 Tax=Thermohalobaculum xanthum TaxID=2753746 RepID=A0A8J7S993_9RHOB|nr:hypothetical protein [Thermohalobaculum xanthum]MBK0397622.1 hypothetical protein [Thermohalobaculum xanthum]